MEQENLWSMSVFKFHQLAKYNSSSDRMSEFEGFLRINYGTSVGDSININEMLATTLIKLRQDFAFHLMSNSLDSQFKLTEKRIKNSYNFFSWMIRFRQGGVVSIRKKEEYFNIRREIFKEYYLLKNNIKKEGRDYVLCSDGINRFISYFHPIDKQDYHTGRTDLKKTKVEVIKKVHIDTHMNNIERLHPYILKYCEIYLEFRDYLTDISNKNLDLISPQKIVEYITNPSHYYRRKNSLCKYYHDPFIFKYWADFFEKCYKNMGKSINDKKNKPLYFNAIKVIVNDDLIKKLA